MTDRVAPKYLVDKREWRQKAMCKGSGVDFFVDGTSPGYQSQAAVAISMCMECPVRLDCIIDCAQTADSWANPGIWAGTTNAGRRHKMNRARVGAGNVTLEELPIPPYVEVLVA